MTHLKQIVGLDIGARNVRAVWMQLRGSEPQVLRTAQMVLPLEGGDRDDLLRSWLASQGLQRGFAAIGVPGTQVVFQPGRLAPEDPRTPRQASEMELATFNDMAGETMSADIAAHEWTPGVRIYLMAMARPAVITEALDTLGELNIRAAELVPSPSALFNALMPLVRRREFPALFIDIGHSHTELAIGGEKGILYARSFAVGGRSFTEALARLAGVPLSQAELQKHRDGSVEVEAPFAEALRPQADRWFSQLTASLSAYRSSFSGEQFSIGSVTLSGGGSKLRGLRGYIEERMGVACVLAGDIPDGARSFAPILQGHREAPQEADLTCFATAFGLARSGLSKPLSPLSLLPENLRGEAVFREKKPFLIAASALGAMALGVMTGSMVITSKTEIAKLDAERAELRRRESMDKSIASIRQRGDSLRKQSDPLRRLLLGGPMVREVISLVANSISPGDWISMICEESSYSSEDVTSGKKTDTPPTGFFVPGFRYVGASSAPKAEAKIGLGQLTPAPEASDFTTYIIEGYTPDAGLTTVNALIQRLRTSRRVRKVDLLSDDRVLPPSLPVEFKGLEVELPNMRRFVIRLEAMLP